MEADRRCGRNSREPMTADVRNYGDRLFTNIKQRRALMVRALTENDVKKVLSGLVASVMVVATSAAMAQNTGPLKLGAVLDMSGLFADITGPGSEAAAKMAVEDFGGEVLGRKVQIVVADHLNKSDLAANFTR